MPPTPPRLRHAFLLVLLACAGIQAAATITLRVPDTLRAGQGCTFRAFREGRPDARFNWDVRGTARNETYEDAPGEFEFRAVLAGTYQVRVTCPDGDEDGVERTLVVLPAEPGAAMPPSHRRAFRVPHSGRPPGGYQGLAWDRRSHTLVAAHGHRIERLHPAAGLWETLADLDWGKQGLPPRPAECAGPRPLVEDLCLDPSGGVFFTLSAAEGTILPQVWRLDPVRGPERIAGTPSLAEAGAPVSAARDGDALGADFYPAALAAGAKGQCYVADPDTGWVLELFPRGGSGYGVRVIAGRGAGDEDKLDPRARPAALGDCLQAREALLDPVALALCPDGSLAVADQRHARICRLTAREDQDGGHWSLNVLAGPGREDPGRPGEPHPLGTRFMGLHRLAAGPDGTLYAKDYLHVWEIAGASGDRPAPLCRVIAGPGPATGAPWRSGDPAQDLRLDDLYHMAAAPGGALLLAGPELHWVTAEGDTALGLKVQDFRAGRGLGGGGLRSWLKEGMGAARHILEGKACTEAMVLRVFQHDMAVAAIASEEPPPLAATAPAPGPETKASPRPVPDSPRPAAQAPATYRPGDATRIPLPGLEPRGVACLDADNLLILDGGAGRGRASRLVMARALIPGKRWFCKVLHARLPPLCHGLTPGPGTAVTVGLGDGGSWRLPLAQDGGSWFLAGTADQEPLGEDERKALGLEEGDVHSLVTTDGTRVLSQGRKLVWPSKAGGEPARVLRLPAAPGAEAQAGPERALILTQAGDGRILALDTEQPAAVLVHPESLACEPVKIAPGWPEDLLPETVLGCGDRFLVRARPQGGGSAQLLVLGPRKDGSGPWPLRDLGVRLHPGAAFCASPEGHLLICDPAGAALQVIPPRGAAPQAAPTWSQLEAADADGDLPFLGALAGWNPGSGPLPELLPGGINPALGDWRQRRLKKGPGPAPTPAGGFPGLAVPPDAVKAPGEDVRFTLPDPALDTIARWLWRHADQANAPGTETAWCGDGRRSLARFGFGCYRDGHRVILELYDLLAYTPRIDPCDRFARDLEAGDGATGSTVAPDGTRRTYAGVILVLDTRSQRIEAYRPGGRLLGTSSE